MKSFFLALPLLAAFTPTTLAQFAPSCSYNDCMQAWNFDQCTSSSGWDCICSNATAIAQINTCVATSCTNATDQEAIYGAIAQLCANNGVKVTNSQQATFSATSGGSLLATITNGPSGGYGPGGHWGPGAWSSWVSACSTAIGSAPSGWNGNGPWGSGWRSGGGPGGWGGPGGSWSGSGSAYYTGGPWGTKASGIACSGNGRWTTWTAGWGPFSSWTGTWSGCSSTTATPQPATVTTTLTTSGHTTVLTGTTFGIQAAAASQSPSASANSANAAASSSKMVGICGGVAAAVFGMMIAL